MVIPLSVLLILLGIAVAIWVSPILGGVLIVAGLVLLLAPRLSAARTRPRR